MHAVKSLMVLAPILERRGSDLSLRAYEAISKEVRQSHGYGFSNVHPQFQLLFFHNAWTGDKAPLWAWQNSFKFRVLLNTVHEGFYVFSVDYRLEQVRTSEGQAKRAYY